MFEVPNLDAMDDEDLTRANEVFGRLTSYSEYSLAARRYRREGNVRAALVAEKVAEIVYQKLPDWARW